MFEARRPFRIDVQTRADAARVFDLPPNAGMTQKYALRVGDRVNVPAQPPFWNLARQRPRGGQSGRLRKIPRLQLLTCDSDDRPATFAASYPLPKLALEGVAVSIVGVPEYEEFRARVRVVGDLTGERSLKIAGTSMLQDRHAIEQTKLSNHRARDFVGRGLLDENDNVRFRHLNPRPRRRLGAKARRAARRLPPTPSSGRPHAHVGPWSNHSAFAARISSRAAPRRQSPASA